MTKKEEFLNWCKKKKFVSSIMASQWGLMNYYHRAERSLREFAELGYCKRLNWPQKVELHLMRPTDTEISWCKF